jgi:hypothetical protein
MCAGCGRETPGGGVACPGCGRALSQGLSVPPGWGVSETATDEVTAPRWRLAGLETARPAQGPNETMPRTPAELFRPAPGRDGGAEALDREPLRPGGTGWRIRGQQPTLVFAAPAASVADTVDAPALTPRIASRLLSWALIGGILATSSAAVILLAVHMIRGR